MAASGMGRTRALSLLARYGSKALSLAQRLAASGDVPLQHAPDYSAAELSYLCLETGVVHLDDLVIRRTLLAIRGLVTDAALAEISGIAAEALGWDAVRAHQELSACATALRERHNVRLQAVAPDVEPSFDASLMASSALGQS
jgi:glycerol-3-phosphate dehydrogenase